MSGSIVNSIFVSLLCSCLHPGSGTGTNHRERLLAYIGVSKYADGLPLYRQEAIYLRDGVEVRRSLMAQWMGHLGFELQI